MQTTKLLTGWYRLSGEFHFSNIKREGREWSVDVRVRSSGEYREFGGLWNRKADAFEDAARLIANRDRLYTPPADETRLFSDAA